MLGRTKILTVLTAAVLAGCANHDQQNNAATTTDGGSTAGAGSSAAAAKRDSLDSVGFASPENLVYDADADVVYISNINGDPEGEDDNGFISRLSPDGSNLQLKWIDGTNPATRMDAPKGLALRGDTLFVADVGGVRMFNRKTGARIGKRRINGIGFNGLAFDESGTLYVTDFGPDRSALTRPDTAKDIDAVYRFDAKGNAQMIVRGTQLDRPDGILPSKDGILIAPLGGSEIYRIDAKGVRTTFAKISSGSLDGLFRLPDGSLAVTSWDGKAVYRVSADGTRVTTLMNNVDSPAGVGYDTKRGDLLVTSFNGNRFYHMPLPMQVK